MTAKDLQNHLNLLEKHSADWKKKMDKITEPDRLELLKIRFSEDMTFYTAMANKYRSMREAYRAEVNTYADLLRYANKRLDII